MTEHKEKLKNVTACILTKIRSIDTEITKENRDTFFVGKTVGIGETPIFKALNEGNEDTYNSYIQMVEAYTQKQKKYQEATWEELLALTQKIKDEGFKVVLEHPVMACEAGPGEVLRPINITVGRKRTAILAHLYGLDAVAVFQGTIPNRGVPLVRVET